MSHPNTTGIPINKPRLFQKPISPPSGKERVIVVAPHQDDESLGCGGRVIQLTQSGAEVTVVYTTDGRLANGQFMDAEEIVKIRKQEAIDACAILGIPENNVIFLPFHDGSLPDELENLTERLTEIFRDRNPTEIFCPYRRDFHSDHEASSQAAYQAIQAYGKPVTRYEYLVWGIFHKPWVTIPKSAPLKKMVLKNTFKELFGLRILWAYRDAVYAEVKATKEQKWEALKKHRSQVSRLVDDPGWLTLFDVADGSWVAQFDQNYEVFLQTNF